ncbi:alpha/beta fold hydrolase [Embleya sp. MST-111070]|uniref:alpha/beta fold hydrolase n=1 Tax=Embleya sp. MST-111070 TaxID=3398231 RepID=UPI003F73F320
MTTTSLERKFAIGVAGLSAWSWAIGARARRAGKRRREAEFSVMPRGDGTVVEVDERRPANAAFGVVFFNGLGLPHEEWTGVRRYLPETAAHVGYNRPGHGLSSPRDGVTLEEHFEIVDELRDRYLDGLPVVLVGHSLGGHLAAAYAELRGDTGLSHVVMVDPTVTADLRARAGDSADAWTRQRLLMERVWAVAGLNVLRPLGSFGGHFSDEIRAGLTQYHAQPRTWATAYREYLAAHSYRPVRGLGVPLHVVTALKGTIAERHLASQQRMLALSERSRHHVYEDVDHMGVVADERCAKALAHLASPESRP